MCKKNYTIFLFIKELKSTESMDNESRLEKMKTLLTSGLGSSSSVQSRKTAGKKRKRENEDEEENGSVAKRSKFSEVDELIQSLSPQVLDGNRRKLKTGFKLFQLVHLEKAKSDKTPLPKDLNKRWNEMEQLKRKYYQDQIHKLFEETATEASNDTADSLCTLESDDETFTKEDNNKTPRTRESKKAPPAPIVKEMVGIFKKDSCCLICEEVAEKSTDLIKCRGSCHRSFHFMCLNLNPDEVSRTEWKCDECAEGKQCSVNYSLSFTQVLPTQKTR